MVNEQKCARRRLDAQLLFAASCDANIEALELDPSLTPSVRVEELHIARKAATEAWRTFNALKVDYHQRWPKRPSVWARVRAKLRARAALAVTQ